ncbi:MAG: hypothetical protein R3C05_06340 [Pirellulaceae bacterium]
MLSGLSSLGKANKNFLAACDAMRVQSEKISIVAFNANVSASSGTLGAITKELSIAEKENQRLLAEMELCIDRIGTLLSELAFNLSVVALQHEIGSHFLRELYRTPSAKALPQLITLLGQADKYLHALFTQLDCAGDWFREIELTTQKVHRNAKTLRFIRISGVAAAAEFKSGNIFAGLFEEVKANIAATMDICTTLRNEVSNCKMTIERIRTRRSMLGSCMKVVQRGAQALPGAFDLEEYAVTADAAT